MPKYAVTLADGHTYEVESDRELSDQEAQHHAEQQSGGSEKPGFFQSLLDTVNPMNIVRAIPAMIPGTEANRAWVEQHGRELQEHPVLSALKSAVPFTGGAGVNAGTRMASGDVAGGAGELVGDFLNTAAPEILPRVPGGVSAVGRGLEKAGTATKGLSRGGALVELATGHPALATATYVAPRAAEVAGRGMQRVGQALEGLTGRRAVDVDPYLPSKSSAPVREYTPSYPEYTEPRTGPTATSPRLQKNFGASLEDRLNTALRSISQKGDEGASTVSGRPSTTDMTPAGKPAISDRRYDELVGKFGGRTTAPIDTAARAKSAAENIDLGSSYGNGHILPEGLPTELRDAALEGLTTEPDAIYSIEHGVGARIPRDLSFEAGDPNVPGLTVGEMRSNPLRDRVEAVSNQLPESWKPFGEKSVAAEDPSYTDFANSIDDTINAAAADELERTPHWRSRLTNAEKQSILRRGQQTPGWPFREIPSEELFNRR